LLRIASVGTNLEGCHVNLPEERRKLSASWLNAIASGAVVTGFIAPTIAVR